MEESTKKIVKISLGVAGGLIVILLLASLVFGNRPGRKIVPLAGQSPKIINGETGMMSGRESVGSPAPRMMSSVAQDSAAVEISQDKKIIKNGNLSLKVEKTETAAEEIAAIAKANGGDVFNSNFFERVKGSKSGTVTVRVPVANFEKTISDIKRVATQVVSESTSGQDVTEEFVDLNSQLKNQQALEQQYLVILQKAQKVQDILDVTEKLSMVRGTIEQLQGRIKYLDLQSDMATISVSLSEDVTIEPLNESWRPWQVVKTAFKTLIVKFQNLVDALIYLVITVLPIFAVILLLVWLTYRLGRKWLEKVKGNS